MEVLYILLCIVLGIGAWYTRKERIKAERNYWKMKYTLDADRAKQAQEQANHSRYGN